MAVLLFLKLKHCLLGKGEWSSEKPPNTQLCRGSSCQLEPQWQLHWGAQSCTCFQICTCLQIWVKDEMLPWFNDICRETSGWFISPAWLPHWWPVCSGKTKLFLSRCGSQRWNVVFFSLKRIMSFPPSYSTSSSKNRTEIYGGMKWGSCTIGFFSITSNIDLGLVDGLKRYVSFFFPLLPP